MRFAFPLLGAAYVLGAVWIRHGHPGLDATWFAAAKASEPVHIAAHLVLYGTCAAAVLARFGPRFVLPATLAVGGLQELAQVVGARPFGAPEAFDLGVDGLAATLVLLGAVAQRTRQTASSAPTGAASTSPFSSGPSSLSGSQR